MIYTLSTHNINPEYVVIYSTQKRQNYRSRFVNSTSLNFVTFSLFVLPITQRIAILHFCSIHHYL
jgi:hypothetical protein